MGDTAGDRAWPMTRGHALYEAWVEGDEHAAPWSLVNQVRYEYLAAAVMAWGPPRPRGLAWLGHVLASGGFCALRCPHYGPTFIARGDET